MPAFSGPPPGLGDADPRDIGTTASAGTNSLASRQDHVHANPNSPPVGSIIAWLKSLSGVPALPTGWVEANGQTINDADSPLNGVAIPDLNGKLGGEKYFLQGDSTSGSTGGSKTPAIAAYCSSGGNGGTGTTVHCNHSIEDGRPPYYTVVWILKTR